MSSFHLLPGRPEPLGAHVRDGGVNVAVWSEHAERIELCLFDATGGEETHRLPLHGPVDGVFHGFLPGARAGLVYGLRAHGPYAPEQGHRFNPHKLLLDPYAREIVGRFEWLPEHHGYTLGHPDGPRSFDARDNAAQALKARVAAPPSAPPSAATARRPPPPRHAAERLVLYEVHVKGFTRLHPAIPPEWRGTYAGMGHPAAIAHLRRLGVTTVSLLPVQYHLDEPHLAGTSRVNYWGYNTLGFFCPDPRLASQPDDPAAVAAEFRAMVDALHAQGIEVVLDVVYNHTPEGNEQGPTLSWRGLDNRSWYRLDPADLGRQADHTGCGNTLNVAHPRVTQFVLDSLRFWVQDMGVDGFRFDLAPVLGRTDAGFDPQAAFFTALRQDPVLARVHLIAEPWDAGPQGYQLGRFPGRFLEWNDRFRDAARGYWLGRGVSRGEFARRFTASSDLFHHAGRAPTASVNFVTVHDGFTLADLVSHDTKHNHANGEDNRDGRDGELCAAFGPEGPSDDPAVRDTRARVQRALLATLMLAQGTPMLHAGDELGRSQGGNNNAYCQDNATSWLDWEAADEPLQRFVQALAALRQEAPLLRHPRWFVASPAQPGDAGVAWLTPEGTPMQATDWQAAGPAGQAEHPADPVAAASPLFASLAFACRLHGHPAARHERVLDWLLIFNPTAQPAPFVLPAGDWALRLDSSGQLPGGHGRAASHHFTAPARSLLVLCELPDTFDPDPDFLP